VTHDPLLLTTAVEAVTRAGEMMMARFGQDVRIDKKGTIDLVTEVDVAIERTLQAIRRRDGDVLLASHDGDFAGEMKGLATLGRRVGVLGFQELVSTKLREATNNAVFELEDDVDAFEIVLPRTRPVHIDNFDPEPYL